MRYQVGYASAEGFAAGTQYPDLMIEDRDGLWRPDFAVGGSNLREAQNIVNHLLYEIERGDTMAVRVGQHRIMQSGLRCGTRECPRPNTYSI